MLVDIRELAKAVKTIAKRCDMEREMAKQAFNEIMAGVQDAVAFAKGERRRGVERVVRVLDDVNVRERARRGRMRARRLSRPRA